MKWLSAFSLVLIWFSVCAGIEVDHGFYESYIASGSDLQKGMHIQSEISFFTENIYLPGQVGKTDIDSLLGAHDTYLIASCSPYVCGECNRINISYLNQLAEEFPGQIILSLADWYRKDTEKMLSETNTSTKIKIFYDNKGKNIESIKQLNSEHLDTWYFIVDKNNMLKYLIAITYNELDVQLSDKVNEIIRSYLKKR